MSKRKFIYWRADLPKNADGHSFANVHLLVGYNQASLVDFRAMATELQETFPQAPDSEICGGKVHKSSSVNGFTIITWAGHIPQGEYPGWHQIPNGAAEYCW
jgi:hypothetical protein